MPERLTIARLGAAGDGIAHTPGGPVYVPGALPGEVVTAERSGDRAELLSVEEPSPDRALPFCPYFGRCGGCSAQHMQPRLYASWKREALVVALARAGIRADVDPLRDAHGEGRRRLTFHARRVDGAMRVGFMAARSHRLVPIEVCPVATPALASAPAAAAKLAALLAGTGKPIDIAVTGSEAGLDIDLRGSGKLNENNRRQIIEVATEFDLARLSLHGELLVERRPPRLMRGRAVVVPPPGAFLQATEAGEAALVELVSEAIGSARPVADLFAGTGPFALRLAERAEVHAVDGDPAMLAALDRAARAASGLRLITTEARDLFRRPLLAPELSRFAAVVLDPPRSGAEAQTRQLIASSCDTVVMVSCDPGTFARDAAALVGGGLRLERVTPVDQFKWTRHLEMVGVFRRETRSAARGKSRQG